ncbi:MAG TPA: UDP-N-acetylmuramoyl-tripeptide--D-alanyl-D-alanine ligase [Methylomirabilota bacterium]|nr:UDP-N-acetylmuramoyl-tripeptide--D-alanyl-D-alanine ligase [Methylomirabilota bacterium]
MAALTLADVMRGTEGALVAGRLEGRVSGVSIDSRTCAPGAAFFAIRGHHQDGHAFIGDALQRGAAALVVTHLPADLALPAAVAVILVEDTTQALQRLAAFHRRRHGLPVVGITGSNGKTTTKELAAAVLAQRFRVLKAAGSLNNQWGLPLTLLQLEADHQVAVVELGMNAFGEIAALAQIAQPTIGVLTTIAPAHLEGLGSIEGVQKAKAELVHAIPPEGVVVLNADDPLVLALAREARAPVLTYGQAEQADVRLSAVAPAPGGLAFTVTAGGRSAAIRLPLLGRHNAWNAAAAVAVGTALGLPPDAAAEGLARVAPVKGRLLTHEVAGVVVLDDTYNANPVSLRGALDTLRELAPHSRAWVLLGDMLELGPASEAAHAEAGRWVAALPAAGLVTVGPAMRAAAAAARAAGCPDVAAFDAPEAAVAYLMARVARGDRVLVKGSRGMRMERAVDALLAGLRGGGPEPRRSC